jgi:hypothetical protein
MDKPSPSVQTDGSRLYVEENIDGRYIISQVSTSGGDTVPMPIPLPNVWLSNISPQRFELLVNSFTGSEATMPLWVVPALGGSPRRFVEPSGNEGAWMPNGNRLLARVNELFEIDRNGEQKKLASLPSDVYIYLLRWSPDHKTLRFIANDQTGDSIWEMARRPAMTFIRYYVTGKPRNDQAPEPGGTPGQPRWKKLCCRISPTLRTGSLRFKVG